MTNDKLMNDFKAFEIAEKENIKGGTIIVIWSIRDPYDGSTYTYVHDTVTNQNSTQHFSGATDGAK